MKFNEYLERRRHRRHRRWVVGEVGWLFACVGADGRVHAAAQHGQFLVDEALSYASLRVSSLLVQRDHLTRPVFRVEDRNSVGRT